MQAVVEVEAVDFSVKDASPAVADEAPATRPRCSNTTLKQAIIVLSFAVVALAAALTYVLIPTPAAATPSGSTVMTGPVSSTQVHKTRYHFNGGEEEVEQFYSKPTTLTKLATSNSRFARFEPSFEDASHPVQSDAYAAGVTHMINAAGETTHEMRLEVLEGGAATLGEFADKNGQVGTKSVRLTVVDKKTMDRFYIIPIGVSMTPNQTLWPDLFYFSFQKNGTALEERVVSFCSTAAFTDASVQCFLGKGQTEWEHTVAPWATAYVESMNHQALLDSRRLRWWNHKSSASAAPAQHTKWHAPLARGGAYAGGKLGGKVGGEIGGKVGGAVGEVAGEGLGGFLAGPVGAAIGGEIGHWAGEKLGTYEGEKIGTAVGRKLGSAAGGWVGDHIGTKRL